MKRKKIVLFGFILINSMNFANEIEITQENINENRSLTNINAVIEEGTELRCDLRIIVNENAFLINKGVINSYSHSDSMLSSNKGKAINEGVINLYERSNAIRSDGGVAINDSDGIINVIGERTWGMYTYKKGVVINKGIINLIGEDIKGICIYGYELGTGRNEGTINVINGINVIGVSIQNNNFYNSGIINALGQKAIEMDDNDSILELGAGTFLRGTTDGMSGEDNLILSGTGTVDVGNESVYNFEKIVATGDILAKGTYNLEVSNGSKYSNAAFNGIEYDITDVSGAPGNLTLDGTINLGVNYDGIDKNGTDKTGKIIARTISKNGHIILTKKGLTNENIIDEAKKSDINIDDFRIKGIATVKGNGIMDPTFFETKGLFAEKDGWKTMTVGDRVGANGSILLDQRYFTSDKISKILIPRNKVDLDTMNRLSKIKNNLVLSNNLDLSIGEDIFTADYLGTKGKSRFMESKSYNYDYDVNTDGVAFTYMYKIHKDFSVGTAFSYEKNQIKYNNVKIGNVNVAALSQNHTETIDSYNTQIFTKYENNNINLVLDLGYGLSSHKANTNFISGMKDGKYDSHILKAGIQGSYSFNLENDLTDETKLVPTLGLEYINVFEDSCAYENSVKLESANGDGYIGNIGFQLKNKKDKISWNYGVNYKYNSKDTFHNKRKVSGYNLEVEELDYSRRTLSFNLDTEYSVSQEFSLRAGYEYEKNDNYRNNNINLGFTYKF